MAQHRKEIIDGKLKCSKCKYNLPLSDFDNDKRTSTGKKSYCKVCRKSNYDNKRIKAPYNSGMIGIYLYKCEQCKDDFITKNQTKYIAMINAEKGLAMKRMNKKSKNNEKQVKELMIIQTAWYYLTLFLEKAGVIKDNMLVKDAGNDYTDTKGAISLGKQIMFILSRVKMPLQQKALDKANLVMKETDTTTEFNYYMFAITLLMEYKENFRNKTYCLPITYDELNTLFDESFEIALKNKEQMDIIKDSATIAEDYYKAVVNYGIKNKE